MDDDDDGLNCCRGLGWVAVLYLLLGACGYAVYRLVTQGV